MTHTYKMLERNGRLGNQMWQIASTIGKAKQVGDTAIFKNDWEYRKYFSVPRKYFGTVPSHSVDGGTDYLQELHYWDNIKNSIFQWFQPSELGQYHTPILAPGHKTAVHFRRGDYLLYPKHFPQPGPDYYRNAMQAIYEKKPDTTFYLFSDDWEWCRLYGDQLVPDGAERKFVRGIIRPVEVRDRKGEPQDQFDMFQMMQCQSHVISNSTFAWWGAYLSGSQDVTYPSRWYGPALADIPWHKMIPKNWNKGICSD